MTNKRSAPRIKFNAIVKVDISDMEEDDLKCTEDAFEANMVDISIQGIQLNVSHNISESVLELLLTGKKKVRLNFQLKSDKAIHTFATLARHAQDENSLGLKYSDIPTDTYEELKNTLDKLAFC